jgi:hypothetical protein
MKLKIKSAVLPGALIVLSMLFTTTSFGQIAGVIGVKFGFTAASGYATPDDLAPTDQAGILVADAVAVTNWNDLLTGLPLDTGENTTWNIAQDSAGNNLSGVTLTPAGLDDGWFSGGTDCADGRLLYDCWKFNTGNGQTDADGHSYVTFTFANLPGSKYDVYVYVNDNNANYWGNIEANSVIAVGTNVDSDGFNGAESDPCSLANPLHTATGFGNDANYVGMPAVATTAGGTITVTVVLQGGDFGVSGIELVPTGTTVGGPPVAGPPVESPATADIAVGIGQSVTLTGAAGGSTPIYYQWQTDGGSGNTPTNIPGATATSLVVNTTGWLPGTYVYDYVAANSLGTNTSATADIVAETVFMEDIGTNTPTPGLVDISQLLNTSQADDSFNYYTDNGANHNEWNGQTFTTGTNVSGYVLNSLSWKSAGNGNSFPTIQLYDLYFYSISADGTTATPIASYQGYGGGIELDWLKWIGLNVPLAPNTVYAYALGRDATSTGWEHIADQGSNPYPGGQLCQIPSGGGTVTYGTTGDSDATFDLGLSVLQSPSATMPTYTPNVTPVYAGTAITLSEAAVGSPPLFYQWLTDNGTGGALVPVNGATGTNLVVSTTALAAGNYNYAVIVTNSSGGSTSAVVTLTLVAASVPQIVTDINPAPANEGYVGQTLTYSATFTGTLPITYQWMLNTGSGPEPISVSSNPSAVSNTLVLSNLQLADAGIYTLSALNSVGGPVSSSASTLTVLAAPAPPASGTYGAMVLSNNPVAFWPLGETNDPSTGILPAYDASGNDFDGLYGVNAYNEFNGFLGPQPPSFPGFVINSGALYTQAGTTNSWVTVPPLNLKTNAVTITMWINPSASVAEDDGLFMNRNGGGDAAGLAFGNAMNAGGMAVLGYVWNTNSAATYNFNSGLYPIAGIWSFVALVVQPTQATIYLYYIDPNTGLPDLYSAANVIPHGPEGFSLGTTLIGGDSYGITREFDGSIADVAVYKQALTSAQLVAQFGQGAGLAEIAPSIAEQPQSIGAYTGNTVNFTANGVNGSGPLTYQWQWNNSNLADGGNISGAETPSLTISNVTTANEGSYQLLVMNPAGTTPSSNATLTVVTPVPGSYESAVLTDDPFVFWKLDETNDPSTGTALAYDYVNGYNGTYQTSAENGFNGILGPQAPEFPGFPSNNTALGTVANIANSFVTASAGALVASNLTYAMWIYPTGPVENWAGLLMDRGGAGEGLGFGGVVNGSGMTELGYTWNQNSTWSYNSYLYPPANQWSFVAMVIEPTKATIYLITTNGVQTAVDAIAQDTEEFGVAWHIGDDAQGNGTGSRTFPGSISDVSVYLTALSSNQVTSLYNVGVGNTATAPVTLSITPGSSRNNLTLTWPQGVLLESTNVSGPWTTTTATSPYVVGTTNASMFFRVKVQP